MSQELYTNGIDASNGGPLDGDFLITTEMIAKVARGQKLTPDDLRDARMRKAFDDAKNAEHFGVMDGIDDTDLAQTGWSVIFPADLPQKSVDAIKEALKPLLDLRKQQAADKQETYYKEVIGSELGVHRGESKNDFLKRFGRGPGAADPAKFPYYALIVGSPEAIPFSFQYQLDVQYAVGRIYFDQLEDYYRYASSVVAAETKKVSRGKSAAFFGVANPEDKATNMSLTTLIRPLAEQMKAKNLDWSVDLVDTEKATKANLANYLGGAQTPALLFSASHGMSFKLDDPRLLRHTGAILTQDWPGPRARVPVTDNLYFSADDISADADVFGMLAFIFACYGGGIPKSDNFYRQAFGTQKDIAPYAFVSQLPLKLLSHPKGGALGVFAHIERAWGASIQWDGAVKDITTFDSTVNGLLAGKPAGAANEPFNERYAEISTMLTEELDSTTPEMQDDVRLAGLWTSNNDARNYTFIGDPAVRLAIAPQQTPKAERANLGALVSSSSAAVATLSVGFQPDIENHTGPVPKPAPSTPGENFGLGDLFKKEDVSGTALSSSGVNDSLKRFMDKLGDYLSRALDDATSLEISTFVAGDMDSVKYEAGKFTGAQLRAVTRISIDGDTLVCVPEKDGEVDTAVWNIHADMVKTAQANRAELMKTIVGAATSIASIVK
ncbi:MAG: hypothetical protein NTW32_11930 [Chloroflexi bacterium]|nr:hypothetical protein [Chloroflexota bacterium]